MAPRKRFGVKLPGAPAIGRHKHRSTKGEEGNVDDTMIGYETQTHAALRRSAMWSPRLPEWDGACFGDVKVYDLKGKLLRVIKAKTLTAKRAVQWAEIGNITWSKRVQRLKKNG